MCDGCSGVTRVDEAGDDEGISRRKLFTRIGFGLGAGLSLAAVPGLLSSASATSAEGAKSGEPSAANGPAMDTDSVSVMAGNAQWCTPAQGSFPNGGQYGAPRPGGSHAGQDISNPIGTALYAAAAGKVIRRGANVLTGRSGNGIVIDHGSGVYTYYGHLNAFRVGLNATVRAGQRIGDMGATGNVTGPHLHFETHSGRLGATANPVTFMRSRGVDLRGGWSSIDSGARGETVKTIQYLLNQRGNSLVIDGQYGSLSVNATKAFQKAQGLVQDGQVGPLTWPKLVYTLKSGAKGNHVKAAQVALNKRSAGLAVDGDYGSVSVSAVRTFQGLNRLVVDGELGPKTWTALVG